MEDDYIECFVYDLDLLNVLGVRNLMDAFVNSYDKVRPVIAERLLESGFDISKPMHREFQIENRRIVFRQSKQDQMWYAKLSSCL